jgi:hypothetical protein
MRKVAGEEQIRGLMLAFGAEADTYVRVYFTGGATAVLLGWRPTTIDVDLRMFPESDRLLRAIPELKETLQINVELASPADFIPELPGWESRSLFIAQEQKVSFFHYDPYAQILAKVERRHSQDVSDVQSMIRTKLVDPAVALRYFEQIEPRLYLYPAINPTAFRRSAEEMLGSQPDPN